MRPLATFAPLMLLLPGPTARRPAATLRGGASKPRYPPPPTACPLQPRNRSWETHVFHWDATMQDPGDSSYLNNTPSAWRQYDWDIVTTVDVFSDGSIDPELLCAAHRHGTRVVIGSVAQNQPIWSGQAALANATHRAALVESIVANVQRYQADGANVDLEQPDPSLRSAMTAFVCELGAALGRAVPGAQLTMDMPARPISYHSLVEYDYTSLAECVDFFVLMVRANKPSPFDLVLAESLW